MNNRYISIHEVIQYTSIRHYVRMIDSFVCRFIRLDHLTCVQQITVITLRHKRCYYDFCHTIQIEFIGRELFTQNVVQYALLSLCDLCYYIVYFYILILRAV